MRILIVCIGSVFLFATLACSPKAQQVSSKAKANPLVLMDGKIIGDTNAIKNVDPNLIESITVLKGEAAVSLYGNKAKDGAVLITRKAEVREQEMHKLLLEKIAGYELAPSHYLFVKDGVLVQGEEVLNLKQLRSSDLIAVETLKYDAAKAIYGNETKEVTVLINTKGLGKE